MNNVYNQRYLMSIVETSKTTSFYTLESPYAELMANAIARANQALPLPVNLAINLAIGRRVMGTRGNPGEAPFT
jgi:hypothetical protein